MMSSMVTWPCYSAISISGSFLMYSDCVSGASGNTLVTPVWMLPFDTEENGSPNGITFHGVLSSPQSNDMPCVAYQDPLG